MGSWLYGYITRNPSYGPLGAVEALLALGDEGLQKWIRLLEEWSWMMKGIVNLLAGIISWVAARRIELLSS